MPKYQINNKIEVAKVGTWNDFPITEEILQEVVSCNSGQKSPVRAGHTDIKKGAKAQGYITNPSIKNGSLWFDQVLYDDLARDFENGYFINRSMDLSKRNDKYMISSLALLGAEAPGIKGLRTFKDEEDNEVLRFTEKINKEASMPTYEEGFKAGQVAKTNELTLKFQDDSKKEIDKVKEIHKEEIVIFQDNEKKLNGEITGLKEAAKKSEDLKFSEKIKEVVGKFPDAEQAEVEKDLKEFADSGMVYEVFAEVAYMKRPEKMEFSEEKDFSEKNKFSEEKEIDEYNSPAR